MQFDIQCKSYYTIDGRRLLRSKIAKPLSAETPQQRYITEFIESCEYFADNVLYQSILRIHNSESNHSRKSEIYQYVVTIEEIVYKNFSSYIIFAILSKADIKIAYGIKTVIFSDDKIIPSKFITNRRKYRNCPLIISKDGTPQIVSTENGNFQILPNKK